MIDIIIPTYNSSKSIIKTLYSIMEQTIVDKVSVYVVDDASDENYSDVCNFFSKYLTIQLLKLDENSGPGVARQYGIDHSHNEYIVFIDSDDEFSSKTAIETLYNGMEGYDMAFAKMYYEQRDEVCFHKGCLHGKMYRRSFLEENHIRFNTQRSHEDNAFNQLCLIAAKVNYIDAVVYQYHYNSSSIVNSENSITSMINFINSMKWVFDHINNLKNINTKKLSIFTLTTFLYCYFNYFLDPDGYSFMFDELSYLKENYHQYIHYLSPDEFQEIYNNYYYDVNLSLTIEEFLDKIKP